MNPRNEGNRGRLVAIDGPHISSLAAVVASLTRIGEKETDRQRTRRLDRRIKKVRKWIDHKSLDPKEIGDMCAAAIVALIEERNDRKRLSEANYLAWAEANEMDKAGAYVASKMQGITQQRRSGAMKKLANDPRQKEKANVRVLWGDWQTGKTKHASGAAFARYVVDHAKFIKSEKTVERWAIAWAKESKAATKK